MRSLAFLSRYPVVLTVTLLLLAVPAWGGDSAIDRATLRGITALHVEVEPLASDVERDGLIQSNIRTDVELRLRQAGIAVVSPSPVALYVRVATKQVTGALVYPAYSVDVDLELWQRVRLDRDPTILHRAASTWSVGFIGTVGSDRVRTLRSDVIDLVDKFIAAYLEQNPKQ